MMETVNSRVFMSGNRQAVRIPHALSLGCLLVTHNTKEFSCIEGLVVEDWI